MRVDKIVRSTHVNELYRLFISGMRIFFTIRDNNGQNGGFAQIEMLLGGLGLNGHDYGLLEENNDLEHYKYSFHRGRE